MGIMFDTKEATAGSAIDKALDAGALFEVHTEAVKVAGITPTIPEGVYAGQPENVVHYRTMGDNQVKVLNIAHPSHPSSNYLQVVETAEALFPGTTTAMKVLEDGAKLFFVQELGEAVDLGDGDTVSPHLLWTASLDSSWSTGAHGMSQRFFCTNQIPIADGHLKVRRSVNHDLILGERSAIMAQLMGRFEVFCQDVSTLKRIRVNASQFQAILDRLVPAPDADAHGKTVNTYEKKVQAIRYYFGEEQGGPAAGTAWAAYNAFQSAELHTFSEGKFQDRKQAEMISEVRHQDLSLKVRSEFMAMA